MAVSDNTMAIKLRRAWIGDLLASASVGCALMWGYAYLYSTVWLPLAVGYLVPVLVYRFSTFWNERPFSKGKAAIMALVMGTLFAAVHHVSLPHWISTATGFIAPFIVSWRARQASADRKVGGEIQSI